MTQALRSARRRYWPAPSTSAGSQVAAPSPGRGWVPVALLAGVITVAGYAVALAVGGVRPFGTRSMLVIDMNGQYAPYIAYMHHVLAGHGSVLFAWPAGLGSNFLAVFAYYLANPLTLLAALAPTRHIPLAVELVTVAKVGLAGVCMTPFLLSHAPRRRLAAAGFAAAYALMSYNVVYSLNIMWLDATYLLPLICLAVDRMLAGRGRLVLGVLLAYTWVVCFYTGYAAVLFGGCYLLARVVMRRDRRRPLARTAATELGWYAGLSVIGVAVAGALLLPTYDALRLRAPQPPVAHGLWPLAPSPLGLLAQHVTGAFDSVKFNGSPNVTVGMAVVLAAVLFFVSPTIAARVRIVWGALLALLAVSLCVPLLTFVWEAFGEANWYLYRFSFVYSFVLVTIGFLGVDAALRARRLSVARLAVVAGVGLAVVAVAAARGGSTPRAALVADAALCLALPGVLVARGRLTRLNQPVLLAGIAGVAVVGLVAGDAIASAAVAMSGKSAQFPFRPASEWSRNQAYARPAAVAAKVARPTGRVVFASPPNPNDALWLGFRGVDFSSTFSNGRALAAMHALGLTLQPINHIGISSAGVSPLSEAVLGVRAMVNRPDSHLPELALVRRVHVGRRVVGIDRVLPGGPVGYLAPPTVTDVAAPGYRSSVNPFTFAEELLGAPHGTLESPAPVIRTRTDNLTVRATRSGVGYRLADRSRPGTVTWTVRVAGAGHLYAHVGTETFAGLLLRAGGVGHGYPAVASNGVVDLGVQHRSVDVSLVLSRPIHVVIDAVHFATVDAGSVARYVASLPALTHVHTGGRSLSGRVDAPSAGILVVSVPYDRGWRARVDGRATTVRRIAGGFLGVPLAAGRHRVALSYLPPGLRAGLVLTALGVAALVSLAVVEVGRRRFSGSSETAAGSRSPPA